MCKLCKVVSPQSLLDKVTASAFWQRWCKRKSRKVAAVVEEEVSDDKVDSHGIVSDIDAQYGIYDDDGGEDLVDYENDRNTLTNVIRVRPMAAKGERTINEKPKMSVNMGEISQDIEGLISIQSVVNHRDRRFRPRAAKGINTPSWSSADRTCLTPVGMPEYKRQAIAERRVAMFQANSCLDSWVKRQMARERKD